MKDWLFCYPWLTRIALQADGRVEPRCAACDGPLAERVVAHFASTRGAPGSLACTLCGDCDRALDATAPLPPALEAAVEQFLAEAADDDVLRRRRRPRVITARALAGSEPPRPDPDGPQSAVSTLAVEEFWDGHTVEVAFDHLRFDFIGLTVRLRATLPAGSGASTPGLGAPAPGDGTVEARLRFSSVFCPFAAMLRWLEAAALEVDSCGFHWEGEGPDGEAHFELDRLRLVWKAGLRTEVAARVDRRQAVGAFYRGFRDFVESDRYEPRRYEAPPRGQGSGRHPLRELRSPGLEHYLAP